MSAMPIQYCQDDYDIALSALEHLHPPHDRESWLKLLMAAHDAGISEDDARRWSERGDNFDPSDFRSAWRSIKPGAVTKGTLFWKAKAEGWKAPIAGRKLTEAECAKRNAERDARRKQEVEAKAERQRQEASMHEAASKKAIELWEKSQSCETHPYLLAHQVPSYGLRYGDFEVEYEDQVTGEIIHKQQKALLVPLQDHEERIWSLQAISANKDGLKLLLRNGKMSGNFFRIGSPNTVNGRRVYVLGEGYATCASLHQATGHAVLVCFNAGNMRRVARELRERDPEAFIVVGADNDIWGQRQDGTPHNTGIEAACKVAEEVGARVAVPPFRISDAMGTDEKGRPTGPKDWNDWHMIHGLESVTKWFAPMLDMSVTVVLAPDSQTASAAAYAFGALPRGADLPGSNAFFARRGPSDFLVTTYEDDLAERTAELCARHPQGHVFILARPGKEQETFNVANGHGICAEKLSEFGGGQYDTWFDALMAAGDARADGDPAAREQAEQSLALVADGLAEKVREVADSIKLRLCQALGISLSDTNQIELFGLDVNVISRIIRGSFWSGSKSKVFLLNPVEALNQFHANEAIKFLSRAFGSPVESRAISKMVEGVISEGKLSKVAQKELRDKALDAVAEPILDYLKFWNQRESVEWRTDMFAKEARIHLTEDIARIVLTHKPFEVFGSGYEQAIIDDYKQHFTRFDEFLSFLVMSRFILDRKKCYLWILADSDWGKGFLLGILNKLGIAVCTSMKEIEAMFEGQPVGRTPEEFKRAFALVVDEFKSVKSELKQLQSEITLSPKNRLVSRVEVFAKLFLSAENVSSLVTENGVEDQFANRMSVFKETGSLVLRPLYLEVGNPRYFASVLDYTSETMNRIVAEMQNMERIESQTIAESWINSFIQRYGIDTMHDRFSDSLSGVAADVLEWLYQHPERLLRDDDGFEPTRYFLRNPNKVLSSYFEEHFDASEVQAYRRRKPEILRLLSADGRGNWPHTIAGKQCKCVALMRLGSTAQELAAPKGG